MTIELILGGVRSGKSRYAEQCASESGKEVVYIATATPGDTEMEIRIQRHRQERPSYWKTVEEPIRLADVLQRHASSNRVILIDCLTLWLCNVLFEKDDEIQDALFKRERRALLEVLPLVPGHILMVSNEVGLGIVPSGQLARRFVDEAGRLHQDLGRVCERVVFVIAGFPQVINKVK